MRNVHLEEVLMHQSVCEILWEDVAALEVIGMGN